MQVACIVLGRCSRQLLLDRCSRRGSTSCIHAVVRCPNFLRPCRSPDAVYLGNRSLRCSTSCIPAVVLLLTAREGGNVIGLLAAPPHPCVRGISASDLQGWPLSHVLCFAAPARLGNCSSTAVPDAVLPPPSMESCVALPSYFPVGRRCNGGNAEGL